jgi:hypothetical protein
VTEERGGKKEDKREVEKPERRAKSQGQYEDKQRAGRWTNQLEAVEIDICSVPPMLACIGRRKRDGNALARVGVG